MDMHDIAVKLAGQQSKLKLRQGTTTAVAADGTLSVTVAGSAVVVTGIKALASVCPKVGAGVWLATDGRDLFAIGTILPVGPAAAAVVRTTDQSIPNDTETTVNFLAAATVEFDTHGMWSTSLTTRLTVQVPGYYLLTFQAAFGGDATGYRSAAIQIGGVDLATSRAPSSGGVLSFAEVTTVRQLAVDDIIQAAVRQTSGAALDLKAYDYTPRLSAHWLRGPS